MFFIDATGLIRHVFGDLASGGHLRTEDIVGRRIFDFLGVQDADRALGRLQRHLAEPGHKVTDPLRVTVTDGLGKQRVIECRARNRLHVPEINAIVVAIRDVTREADASRSAERSSARLDQALRAARAVYFETDYITDSVEFDPLWFELARWKREDWFAVANPFDSRIHPEDQSWVLPAMEEFRLGRRAEWEAEYRMATGDGAWLWMLDRGTSIERDAEGRVTRMVSVLVDIDARKRAEEALRESEFRYRAALDTIPGVMFEYRFAEDGGMDLQWVMGNCEDLTGYTADDLRVARRWFSLLHPDEIQASIERQRRQRAGEATDAQVRITTRRGETRWLRILHLPRKDAKGLPTGAVLAIAHDVTPVRAVSDALRQSEFLHRSLAELTPGFVFQYDLDLQGQLHLKSVSDGFDRMMGCTRAEASERGWRGFCHPDDRERLAAVGTAAAAGHTVHEEVRMQDAAGRERFVEFRARPVHSASAGRIVGIIGSAVDRTEERMASTRLRAVLAAVPAWFALLDSTLQVTYANREAWSTPRDRLLGKPLLDMVPADMRTAIGALLNEVMLLGEPRGAALSTRTEAGRQRFQAFAHPLNHAGHVGGVAIAVFETTAQRATEDTLTRALAAALERDHAAPPRALEELTAGLQALAQATAAGGPPAHLQVNLAASPVLPGETWKALHEFARHALALSRAAGATRIEVRLAGDATGVRLEVADERAPGEAQPESTTVTSRLFAHYADLAGGRYTLGPRPIPGTLAALHVPATPSKSTAIS